MSQFNPRQLHVRFLGDASPEGPEFPRRYTLTHSDTTGELFLTIGSSYDRHQISGWYTRLMRDEVLAEWRMDGLQPFLEVHCHVSGGFVFGSPGWRYSIFQSHMRHVLQAMRYGDDEVIRLHPELDQAPVQVRFHAAQAQYRKLEHWGRFGDYQTSDLAQNIFEQPSQQEQF